MAKLINQFNTIDVSTTDDPKSIAMGNLLLADKHLNIEWFIASAIGWLKANPGKNLKDLELALREENMNTYLIGLTGNEKKNISDGKLWLPNEDVGKVYTHECFFCCKQRDMAYATVMNRGGYNDNLAKLADCGILTVLDKTPVLHVEGTKVFTSNEKEKFSKVSNNQAKLKFEQINQTNFIKQLASKLNEQHNGNIQPMMYGMNKDNKPIIAFCIDGKIVSNIGYVWNSEDDLEVFYLPMNDVLNSNK